MNLQEIHEAWDREGSEEAISVTLSKIPNTGDMKTEDFTSCCYEKPQFEGYGHKPTHKTFNPKCGFSKIFSREKAGAEE